MDWKKKAARSLAVAALLALIAWFPVSTPRGPEPAWAALTHFDNQLATGTVDLDPIGGYDRAAKRWRTASITGDGALEMTELYPDYKQTGDVVIMSGVATAAQKSYTAVSASAYGAASEQGWKYILLTVTGGTAASPWRWQWLASTDGGTYNYIVAGTAGAYVDGDTLSIKGHGPGTWWFPISAAAGYPEIIKFLKGRGVNDTAAAAFTFSAEVVGRQH